MKNIILIILLFAGIGLNGQTITGDKVITRTQLELAGYKVTGISNDTLMGDNSIMKLPTQYAAKRYSDNVVSRDTILGTSKTKAPSQYAVKKYVDGSGVTPSGSSGQVQYNNSGAFGALDSLTVSANPDRIGIGVPVPTARVDIQGSGSTSATNAFRIRNSSGQKALEIKDNMTIFGYNSSSQITTALGDITTGAMGIGTRNNQFTFGAIDVGTGHGLRILGRSTGLSYIDGWTEGASKAQNYDIIIGARVNNTLGTIANSTTAETGSNVQIGFEATTNPRAILSLNTTTRGFLPPRMTTTQRDAVTWVTGDAGMIIFNTTLVKLQVWNGTAWETITSI